MSATEAYFVTRTMRALELLAFGPLSVPQLAETMQIHPRTARRMISRLADEEYVTLLDGPRRRYALTMRVVALAGQWLEHSTLPRLAAPFVALLDAQTGLTGHLVIPAYDCVLCLVHSGEGGVPAPRLRELVPAHCTAGGKALLVARAGWCESVLTRPLAAFTDRTLTDPCAIAQELEATRRRGYAVENGEYRRGVEAVAAAVHDRAGAAIAAIGVSGTGRANVDTVSDDVVSVAARLGEVLAHERADRAR